MKIITRILSLQFVTILLFNGHISSCNGQAKNNVVTTSTGKTNLTNLPVKKIIPKSGNTIIEDRKGNLWCIRANQEGVSVYDGKTLKTYRKKDGLSADIVNNLIEDNEGNIWMATDNGVTIYKSGSFEVITMNQITGQVHPSTITYHPDFPNISLTRENAVFSILQDSKGVIWLGTLFGIYRLINGKFLHFTQQDFIINDTGINLIGDKNNGLWIEDIFEDNSGNVWFGGRGIEGVFCFDGSKLINLNPDNRDWLVPIFQDGEGRIFFARRRAMLAVYDGKSFKDFGKGIFTDFFLFGGEDAKGIYWFGTYSYDRTNFKEYPIFNQEKNELIWLQHLNNDCFLIDNSESLTSQMIDSKSNIWLWSNKNNLYKFNDNKFEKINL